MAVGFAACAIWRWSVAAVDGPDVATGSAVKKSVQRLGALAMGLVYPGLCVSTVLVVTGRPTSSSTQQQQGATGRLLALPAGHALAFAIGAGVVIGGCIVIWRALSRKFEKKLATTEMGPRIRRWAIGLGVAGNGAGGVVLALVGIFLIQAAAVNNARNSVGWPGGAHSGRG
jgi:hypothetical protein